jgi:peptidyl-prolyl cis-trans isomerase SurA
MLSLPSRTAIYTALLSSSLVFWGSLASAQSALPAGLVPGPGTPSNSAAIPDMPVGARFENGIAAVVEDRIITVGDIRRIIEPLIPQIRSTSRTPAEFRKNLEKVEDQAIQDEIDKVLIVKDFYSDEKRKGGIPQHYVDNQLEEELITQFDNDRSKFLAYLRSIGKTHREYRQMIEEDIIVGYMRGQKRKTLAVVSPAKIENYYTEHRDNFYQDDGVHLRLILLKQIADENPALLNQTAESIMQKLRDGADFAEIAKEFSQDSRKKNGGDWGWIARGDLREELANAAFALDKGQFSEPVKLENEIFILFVEDKRLAGIKPLEDVRDQIERALLSQMARESTERWLERLRRTGYVRYFN